MSVIWQLLPTIMRWSSELRLCAAACGARIRDLFMAILQKIWQTASVRGKPDHAPTANTFYGAIVAIRCSADYLKSG